jgi:hypothetical protein
MPIFVGGMLVVGLLAARPAAGSELVMTFSGTVSSVTDSTNLFGLAPGVTSATFSDTFTFDLSNPGRSTGPGYDELYGGLDFGTVSPLIDSRLTINGHTIDFPGGASDEAYYGPLSSSAGMQAFIGPRPTGTQYFDNIILLATPLSNLDTPGSASGSGFGNFYICEPPGNLCNSDVNIAAGNFSPTEFTATISSGAPEPTAWALLLLGLGAVGGMARAPRRKRVSAIQGR